MMKKNDKSILMLPIKIGIIYSIITVILYEYGVWGYPEINRSEFNIFIIFAHIAMYLGFYLGTHLNSSYIPKNKEYDTQLLVNKILNFAFVIVALTFIPQFIINSGMYDFSFAQLFEKLKNGIEDAQVVYRLTQNSTGVSGIWVYINYFIILTGWIRWAYTPLAVLMWKKLSKFKKSITMFYWLSIVIQYLAAGTNFGIINLGIQLAAALLLKKLMLEKNNSSKEIGSVLLEPDGYDKRMNNTVPSRPFHQRQKKKTFRYIIFGILIIAFTLLSFSNTMDSRIGESYNNAKIIAGSHVTIDEDNFLWRITPDTVKPFVANFSLYITHGYNALAMAINLPFSSTLGCGASWFLLDNMIEMFGIDLYPRTFFVKTYIAYGWLYNASYSTAYLALANDVSFLMLPVFLFVLMLLFGFAWKDLLLNRNPCAYLMMMMFVIFVVYLPAQCYLFALPDTLFAFWIFLFLWLFNRKKLNWNRSL